MTGRLALAAAVLAGTLLTGTPAEARGHRHRTVDASDIDRTLARMAERDRVRLWPRWEEHRALASYLPPFTRERVAAPPLTGWGYGGTVPGAWPGF